MKDFWETIFICLAEITIVLIILFWYVIPDPVVRWIMMVANLVFTLIFITYSFKLSKKK